MRIVQNFPVVESYASICLRMVAWDSSDDLVSLIHETALQELWELSHDFTKSENFLCKLLIVYVANLCILLQILDLVPILTRLYFKGKLPVTMSYAQASVLLCIGLQGQSFTYVEVCFSTCPSSHLSNR